MVERNQVQFYSLGNDDDSDAIGDAPGVSVVPKTQKVKGSAAQILL
jgi:hypothetical protein